MFSEIDAIDEDKSDSIQEEEEAWSSSHFYSHAIGEQNSEFHQNYS